MLFITVGGIVWAFIKLLCQCSSLRLEKQARHTLVHFYLSMHLFYTGVASVDPQQIREVLNIVEDSSGYVLCPGLKPATYEDMVKTTRFHRQGIRIFDCPTNTQGH